MFYIKRGVRVMGVADYVDEAREFAERITGWAETTTWLPNGHLILNGSGEPTGWKIERVGAGG